MNLESHKRYMRYADLPYLNRNLAGEKICVWCGCPLTGRKTRWCGQKCIDEYCLRNNGDTLRRRVHERDQGICADCGADCNSESGYSHRYGTWHAHHVNPVHRGGGACDLDNMVTLCVDCHKARHRTRTHK